MAEWMDRLATRVSQNVQSRGRLYARNAVVITGVLDHAIEAEVRGTDLYDVSLERAADGIIVDCSCPYFLSNWLVCKHIWATILVSHQRGLLARWEEAIPARFITWLDQERATLPQLPSVEPDAFPSRQVSWKVYLREVRQQMEEKPERPAWPAEKRIIYVAGLEEALQGRPFQVELWSQSRKKGGEWSKPRSIRLSHETIPSLPDALDRRILLLLMGAPPLYESYAWKPETRYAFPISADMIPDLLPVLCSTGRFLLRSEDDDLRPVSWDDGPPWEFWLEAHAAQMKDAAAERTEPAAQTRRNYVIAGSLRREGRRLDLSAPELIISEGLVFIDQTAARLDHSGAFSLASLLREERTLTIPQDQVDQWVEELFRLPYLPRLDLPSEMRYEEVRPVPRPRLKIEKASWAGNHRAELSFDYDGVTIPSQQRGGSMADADARRRILRDAAAEQAAVRRMERAGVRHYVDYGRVSYELAPSKLPAIVRNLAAEGWHIEAEGKLFRNPGAVNMSVSSGIDWFELRGSVEFGEASAPLPQLLASLKKGERTIRLDDGTFGVIPEEWLRKFGLIVGLAQSGEETLRFSRAQTGILDALLEEQPGAEWDEQFAQARARLKDFEGIQPAEEPPGFVGRLRGYQRDGLGWLHFLERFGFGGCLADDMGLGKTVQVLALIEARRRMRVSLAPGEERPGPSLVVVPRSLVFNWKQEAARFTPQMRVLDHTGAGRLRGSDGFEDFDLVLTTYGTLRRDIFHLKDAQFDYVVLDEAQAIKNAATESAKAARLLRGQHRLALSGTPIENHLGELWSLFEFINPGMLGSSTALRLGQGELRNPDASVRRLLARALRPFILRRTKEQVANDLPPKMEQTLYCELEPVQRELYDQLRDHYRRSLLGMVDRNGIARSQMQILEALLRLRQAAIHPGLIDSARAGEPSAKLDMLIPQLQEVLAEGHKALVFSQFTSMLAILRARLDQEKTPYEYLDGQTRDRQRAVTRFQEDPDCALFLISLRAGGLGLNLTAAEYVFMLDPWWNPAVEAQAIDRTHRIGQTRPVFAYRLIAKDTVEEKVLQLQESKRELADAILTEDNSMMRSLRREDLDLLLS